MIERERERKCGVEGGGMDGECDRLQEELLKGSQENVRS